MKRILVLLFVCITPLFLTAQTGKDLYELSINYNNGTGGVKKDVKKARKLRMKAAQAGYAEAQYSIGVRYYNGTIVKRDYEEAVKWFQKAAAQEHANAIYALAQMHDNGIYFPKDKQKALEMYLPIAERGHMQAIKSVANIYHYTMNQPEKELEWWKRGAEFGHAFFMLKLAEYHEQLRDYAKAEDYYTKALEKKDDLGKDDVYNAESGLYRVQKIRKNTAVDLRQQGEKKAIAIARLGSDVDRDIPMAPKTQEKTFALIISNENYDALPPVPYAANDGETVDEYFRQALGIPGDNIHKLKDATYGQMKRGIVWLKDIMKAYQGKVNVIIYYAGHGIPSEKSKTGYLLPTDGNAMDVSTAYALEELYKELEEESAKSVIVLLDANFSGARREGTMMTAARGVAIKVKSDIPQGNMAVFSAAQGDETAYSYDGQKHGMFTYFLLKCLKESRNSLTFGELVEYVTRQVMQQSVKGNGRKQTPHIITSPTIASNWKSITIK